MSTQPCEQFDFKKREDQNIRVELYRPNRYATDYYVDARLYLLDKNNIKPPQHTKKGLCLRPALARQVAHAMLTMADRAEQLSEQAKAQQNALPPLNHSS